MSTDDTLAQAAGIIVWLVSALLISLRVGTVVGYEQPMLTALVIIVGTLVCALGPATVIYAVAR